MGDGKGIKTNGRTDAEKEKIEKRKGDEALRSLAACKRILIVLRGSYFFTNRYHSLHSTLRLFTTSRAHAFWVLGTQRNSLAPIRNRVRPLHRRLEADLTNFKILLSKCCDPLALASLPFSSDCIFIFHTRLIFLHFSTSTVNFFKFTFLLESQQIHMHQHGSVYCYKSRNNLSLHSENGKLKFT